MFYVIYVGFYQWIFDKGNYLADQHCINVNPLIIARKNAYLDSMESLLVNYDTVSYMKYTDEYINHSLEYIEREKEWLEDNFEYLNKWYVKFFVNKNIQDTLWLDHKMYETDMNGSIIMVELFADLYEKDGLNQEKLSLKLAKNYNKYQDLEKQIEKKRQITKKLFKNNIRNKLMQIPITKCPAENYHIPDVDKEINKFKKNSEFETTPLPGIIG